MTYSEVMFTSVIIMIGSITFLLVLAYTVSKKRNRNSTPVYATSYSNDTVTVTAQNRTSRTNLASAEPIPAKKTVRYSTRINEPVESNSVESRRVIVANRQPSGIRESSYNDPKFRSVRAPRFQVINNSMSL